jgi:ArsR family transcriptional regulator, arsenate/arsenite/antimonite-responsive transcriptional repressor
MRPTGAVAAFAALGQEHRLKVFRMLMEAGPSGMRAGEIAEFLGVPASSLSGHLATLERAGLLHSWRVQRAIFYAVDVAGTRDLVTFLTQDCCGGRPELCGWDEPVEAGSGEVATITDTPHQGGPRRD